MDSAGSSSRKVAGVAWGIEDTLIQDMLDASANGSEENMEEPDLPTIPSVKSNDRLFRQRRLFQTLTTSGAGLSLVCGCAALLYLWFGHAESLSWWSPSGSVQLWGTCSYRESPTCPARSLLDLPEVHELAAHNIMRLGRRTLGPQQAAMVTSLVGASLRNVSAQLQQHAPQVARELDMVRFTEAQKDATLNSLRLLGDPRIESIGLDIAEAVRDNSVASDQNVEKVSAELTALIKRFELASLEEDLQLARLLWSEGRQWDLTLDPENLRSMARVSGHWHTAIEEATKSEDKPAWGGIGAVAVKDEIRSAIVAAALVQARVLLDIMKVRAHSAVPSWVTSVSSYLGIDPEDVSCDLIAPHAFLNQFACPLKFGVQGMDALRAYFSEQPLLQEDVKDHPPHVPDARGGRKEAADDHEEHSPEAASDRKEKLLAIPSV